MTFKRYFYTDYWVSETGVVKNKKGVILKPRRKNGTDSLFYELTINKERKRVSVDRMVLIAHSDSLDYIRKKVKYIDGNSLNNHISNLKCI